MSRFLFGRRRPSSVPPPGRRGEDDDDAKSETGDFIRSQTSDGSSRRGRSRSRSRNKNNDNNTTNGKSNEKASTPPTQPTVEEGANEDASLSMAAVDDENPLPTPHFHKASSYQNQHEIPVMHWQETPAPPSHLKSHAPVFVRYEEEEAEYHYMVKKTSRRQPTPYAHNNTDSTNNAYHNYSSNTNSNSNQHHSSSHNMHNSNKQQPQVDVTLLQTQLRDAQRVVRAVLNLGDAPLDSSASLRAIRHFAALQKEMHKLQKELQMSQVQKRELEQQWTTLVLEKNQHALHVSQLQAQLEQQQLINLKQQQQQENQSIAHAVVINTDTSTLSLPQSPTKTVVELNNISSSSFSSANVVPDSPALLFLDSSASGGGGSEYQSALEHQLEECQAMLRQRHDELQTLQEQLADARTQLLATSHHLTAQEEVLVLQHELEVARQELDELEQERQMNMSEIVELSQQVLVLQQQQNNQPTNEMAAAHAAASVAASEASSAVAAATAEADSARIKELQDRVTEQEQQLEQVKSQHLEQVQQLESRITELQDLLIKSQKELKEQQQQQETTVQTMETERHEIEGRYTQQIRKIAARALEDQLAEKNRQKKAMNKMQAKVDNLQQRLDESVHQLEQQKQDFTQRLEALQAKWQQEWDSAHGLLRELVLAHDTKSSTSMSPSRLLNPLTTDYGTHEEKKQEEDAAAGANEPMSSSSNHSKSDRPKSSVSSLLAQLKWQREDLHCRHSHALQQIADLQTQLSESKKALSEESRNQKQEESELEQQLKIELEQAKHELEMKTKELQTLQTDANLQRALENQWHEAQQRASELEEVVQELQSLVDEQQAALRELNDKWNRTKSAMATLEQDMGQLQAELDDVAKHDVGQQLLRYVRSKRAAATSSNNSEQKDNCDEKEDSPEDDPFGVDQVDEKVSLQANLFRTQAQLRRQEDMYRLLADEADELRSTLASSQETIEDLEQQRNFNQVKVTELSRMIRLRGKLSDVEEQLMIKINQCATLTTQVDSLQFNLQERQRKMERLEQERQIHMDKLKELGVIWESHALMLQAQKDMQAKVTEVIERWEASEARAEQMQMEREMSVERVTKLSFELAESRARVDELMEELDQERRASQSLHGGSLHGGSVVSSKRGNGRAESLDGSRHGPSHPSHFFGMSALSTKRWAAAATVLSGSTGGNSDDVALRDADTAAGVNFNGDVDDFDGKSQCSRTAEHAHLSTIRKLMKQIERLEDEKTRYADAVTVLESGLQQVQRENVVKSAKIMQLEKQVTTPGDNVTSNNKSFDLDREQVVLQLKQTRSQVEGSMLALQAEMQELRANIKKRDQGVHDRMQSPSSNTAPLPNELIPEKLSWNLSSQSLLGSDTKDFQVKLSHVDKEELRPEAVNTN